LSEPIVLSAGGIFDSKDKGPTLQDRYNALTAPGIVMLPTTGISNISQNVLNRFENELMLQFVESAKLKPVRMQNWLLSTYTNKANNPFVIMNEIRTGQYAFPLQYICKPFVLRSGSFYYYILYVYPLASYYPITIFRQLPSLSMLDDMIISCLEELLLRISQPVVGEKRRIIIDEFKLEFYRLVTHSSGEFDFISTPFIEKEGKTLREGDDYFSRIMGYVLESTNMFQVMQIGDFKEYSNTNISRTSNLADYRIQGRVQVSDFESVLYIDVIDIRSAVQLITLRYPLLTYSFDEVWNAYRHLSVQIVERLFDREAFNVVPAQEVQGKGFFANNMYIGFNILDNFIVGRGLHVIDTGTRFRVDDIERSANTFYILSDNQCTVFKGREGRQIWNLLNK
jgi:hypothetical protein